MKEDTESAPVVMLVDDDPVARRLTGQALRRAGFATLEAENGEQALELFDIQPPDVILLDVRMPGMDGFETCRAIRGRRVKHAHIPIIMVTGDEDINSIRRAYDMGATDFITKPINWLLLIQRVRYILRASQAMTELQKSKALLTKAQQIAQLGSWELDTDTGEFRCSREICSIYGMEPSETAFSYEHFLQRISPEDRSFVQAMLQQAIHLSRPFKLDHQIVFPNGSSRFLSQQVEVVCNAQTGETLQLVGTVQDITERKQAEQFESDRNRVLEMIIQKHPLQDIFSETAGLVVRQRPNTACALLLLQDGRFQPGAIEGLPESFLEATAAQDCEERACCFGAAAYFGQTMMAYNIETNHFWKRHRGLALDHGIKASCSMPVFSGMGKVLGTLTMYSREPFHPSQDDLNLLDSACKLVAVTLEQRQLSQQIAHQARHDFLTGLPNRAAAVEFLQRLISSPGSRENIAVLFIDLDRFKHVNDSLGHSTGDELLKMVAERLKECVRDSDVMARMGGDEFTMILDGIGSCEAAGMVASRILNLLERPFTIGEHELHVGASIGLSIYPNDGKDLEVLQQNADIAMYHAKNGGGNQFCFYKPEMNSKLIERLEIENEMKKAIERGQFEVYYQPQLALEDNRLCGVEALLRWNHPELGRIPPSKFIPIAEESGLIIPIGKWVLEQACQQNELWQRSGCPFFLMSVNISALELMKDDFVDSLKEILGKTKHDPRWLQLEVTESVLLNNIQTVALKLEQIRSLGVSVAIDDFGIGYSSMSYLQQLPVDCLKVDSSFIRELDGTGDMMLRSRALIKTFVQLAQNLGLRMVAEGIENRSQQILLTEIGCSIGQGFLLSEPVPAEEIDFLC